MRRVKLGNHWISVIVTSLAVEAGHYLQRLVDSTIHGHLMHSIPLADILLVVCMNALRPFSWLLLEPWWQLLALSCWALALVGVLGLDRSFVRVIVDWIIACIAFKQRLINVVRLHKS